MGALISSKVNQWTLLVGAIPLVYAISAASWGPMDLDSRQKEELLLTSAQSLFAAIVIADFRFSLWEAIVLMVLFIIQLVFPDQTFRYIFSGVYFIGAIWMIVNSPMRRRMLWNALLLRTSRPPDS
jgi:cation:H+ antiporter